MKIWKILKMSIVVGMISWCSSCEYLNVDKYFYDQVSLDTIFAQKRYLEQYLWGAAAYLPNEGNLYSGSYGPYMTATDETQMSWKKAEYGGVYLMADEITPFSNVYNQWGSYYKGIRKANMILTRIDECKDLDLIDKREILGLTYFLRGYLYFFLVQQYGPVPILPDAPLSVDGTLEELSYERNTYDECVDYICENMTNAYNYLEETRPSSDFYKPTKYAAMAIISRIRLYQASPWYNGNTFYSSWTTSDGRNFISQSYDERKWALSAAASAKIIESGKYQLHTVAAFDNTPVDPAAPQGDFPDGVGGIDPYHSYADMFNGEALAVKNPEIIYPASMSESNYRIAFPLDMSGWNGLGVTQELVDAYYMADGTDYRQTDDFADQIGADKVFSGEDDQAYTLKGSAPKMYDNREARFYATIGFCEGFWPGTSLTTGDYQNRTNYVAEYYSNGNCAPRNDNPEDYNLTGYTCKKYINPIDNFYNGGSRKSGKVFPAMRYAETLLNYVEALNELTTTHTFSEADGTTMTVSREPEKIMKYFNMIRFRAGLPGMTAAEAADPDMVRRLVHRERQIELAHEGYRYHDIRRWGILDQTMSKPCRGCDVSKKKSERKLFFQPITLTHKYAKRVYSPKMYFWPIKRSILDQNPKLVQNPLW